jgi:hypothetical protein
VQVRDAGSGRVSHQQLQTFCTGIGDIVTAH